MMNMKKFNSLDEMMTITNDRFSLNELLSVKVDFLKCMINENENLHSEMKESLSFLLEVRVRDYLYSEKDLFLFNNLVLKSDDEKREFYHRLNVIHYEMSLDSLTNRNSYRKFNRILDLSKECKVRFN